MKIRLLLILFISLSVVTILVSDDAPMEPAQSGNLLPAFNNDIQMKNERIDIHLSRNRYHVEVKYTFLNTGKKQTITVGFPNVDKEGCYITSPINNFTAYDGNRKLDIYTKKADESFYHLEEYSQILTPNNDDDFGRGSKGCNVFFECFDITFEQGETKTITNKYKQKYYINYGGFNRYLTYILKTGAYWKDNIEYIEIFFHLDGLQISERTDQIFYDTYSFEYNDDYNINDIKENKYTEKWIFNPDEIIKINNDLYNMTFKDIEPDFNIELQFPMPIISYIEASSTLKNDSYYYGTDNLYDNNKDTAWVEGVDGDGENEHLFIWISNSAGDYTTRAVSKIGLINGYTKDYTTFMNNNRIKKAKLEITDTFGNVNEKIIHLDDTQDIQYIYLDKPILTEFIKLTILEIYKGNKYSDTCLSEIIVFTDEL